jgi:nickel-dependent lactate racemase
MASWSASEEATMKIQIPFESGPVEAELPEGSEILRMGSHAALADPAAAVRAALAEPIGCDSLAAIARRKLRPGAKACIVVSDKTRPVPYRGPGGLLLPILETLRGAGWESRDIAILVATGMHRGMSRAELEKMLGQEPFAAGIEVVNHDCADAACLVNVGRTPRGTEALINRRYIDADLKILTGLVESHFMAGASGGRKSICPGLLGEEGTKVFHGAELMSHANTRDLLLEGNPVHEESLAVAKLAGADFIANVIVNAGFQMTGIFCGDLEAAHGAAVARLRGAVGIPIDRPYDLVVTHGGFVAQNHYQAAKAAVAALGALAPARTDVSPRRVASLGALGAPDAAVPGPGLILVADNRDAEPVGSDGYRATLALLKTIGPQALDRAFASPDWSFIVDQWEAQMWAKVFKRVAMEDFVYFAPQLGPEDRRILPGFDGRSLLAGDVRNFVPPTDTSAVAAAATATTAVEVAEVVKRAVSRFLARRGMTESDVASGRVRIAWLADGPYGIPLM